jgi:HPt (histidine-containing phosphotransfer) domain-containing protein
MFNDFLSNSQTLINEIKQSHSQGDKDEVKKLIHNLKGITASFGASSLAVLCEKIENHCVNYDVMEIDSLIKQLEIEYIKTQKEILRQITD